MTQSDRPPREIGRLAAAGGDGDDAGDDAVQLTDAPAVEVVAPAEVVANQTPEPASQPRRVGINANTGWSPIVRWGGVAAAAFMLGLLILAWSALRTTQQEEAEALAWRALVSLTEIDALLDARFEDLQAEAARRPGERLTLPNYAVPVSLSAEEIRSLSRADLRARLLSESAAMVYEDGIGVFRREPSGDGGGIFSARGVMRWTVGRLTADTHELLWLVLGVVLILTAPALIIVLASSAGRDRLRNLGIAVLAGGLLMLVTALSSRFALRVTANGAEDPLNAALVDIGADTLAVVLRNAMIVALLGLSLLTLAIGARALEGVLAAGRIARPGLRR